ncbi:MAG: hypothetical protein LBM02_01050 [Lachnospiraceae bacterium]|jgi:magnesium transporter|nr:hypothetical protein [Lachnospiraceae bacterium]
MQYTIINNKLKKIDNSTNTFRKQKIDENIYKKGDPLIEIITKDEYLHLSKYNKDSLAHKVLASHIREIEYSKVEIFAGCAVGTFSVPKESLILSEIRNPIKKIKVKKFDYDIPFGFYLDKTSLLVVEEDNLVKNVLDYIITLQDSSISSVGNVFLLIIENLLKDETIILQKYENRLSDMEEMLLDDVADDFDKEMLKIRRDLLTLQSYYQQLAGVFDILEENEKQIFVNEDIRLFLRLAKKIDRLYSHISLLKEYSIELWELYKAQIDTQQNQTMKYLTVIATIFMPLTLLTGWYGMNFDNMPELVSKHGYLIIIVVSIIIVIAEIWWFKHKKWFD